jgi:hypothetical protein
MYQIGYIACLNKYTEITNTFFDTAFEVLIFVLGNGGELGILEYQKGGRR